MKRRRFIQGAVGLGLATGLYTWQVEPFWLEFVHRSMRIPNLPDHLHGKTVMQISDMHVGDRFDYGYIIDSLKKAKELQPDFVVYTGDYVSYEDERQFDQLKEVLQHTVRGKYGTVGILGNHDYGHNWSQTDVADEISAQLASTGVQVLRNEQATVEGLSFIGLDDYWGQNFHPDQVMDTHDRAKANIVLCHNPDVCDLNVWGEYKGWILSGHTHGGQCKPPFLPAPVVPVQNKKYAAGEVDLTDGRMLYINRALGHLWQVRFNVRPEITIFRLEGV